MSKVKGSERDPGREARQTRSVPGAARISFLAGLVAIVLTAIVAPAGAEELNVRAVVDRNRIDLSETLQLSVIVSGGGGEVDLSAMKDFQVLSQGSSTNVQIVNMKMTRESRYTYLLAPRRAGALVIPSLTVRSGDETATTEPVRIQVGASGRPGSGGSAGTGEPRGGKEAGVSESTRDASVEATVSNANPWLGEPVVYTFTFSRRVQVAEARFDKPSFAGFSAKEQPEEKTFTRVVGGIEYQVTELRFELLPLAPGPQTIDPAALAVKVPVERKTGRRRVSPFNDPFFNDPFFGMGRTEWEQRIFRSHPVSLRVRELPPLPKGMGVFSGLLGDFSLSAEISPVELAAGDSATLTLKLKGEGNVAEAKAPGFAVPDGVRVYPDQPETSEDGAKRFSFALVPSEPGAISLGPFALNYFDPKSGSYKTARAAGVTLNVKPARADAGPVNVTVGEEQRPAAPGDATEEQVVSFLRTVRNPKVGGSIAGAVLVLLLLWKGTAVLRGRLARRDRERARLRERARTALAAARKEAGGDGQVWADAAYEAILVAARLKTGSSVPPNPEELGALFGGGKETVAREMEDLLHRIEEIRFGGRGNQSEQREELTARIARIVDEAVKG